MGDFASAFGAATEKRADAVLVLDDALVASRKEQILHWAAMTRLPVMSQYRELADSGALMAYGPNIPEMYRRAAYFVDKVLRGSNPGEIPIEQPTKFELVINRRTANALGLTISPSILLRADRVIE